MSLQSSETQELKYKKRTITTFGFPSTSFCPKFSQNPTADVDGDQREFDLETRVITNENIIIPKMFHSCALNK